MATGDQIIKTNNGWICPKCGSVYAPHVSECTNCNSCGYEVLLSKIEQKEKDDLVDLNEIIPKQKSKKMVLND